jgi:hypothetical protein
MISATGITGLGQFGLSTSARKKKTNMNEEITGGEMACVHGAVFVEPVMAAAESLDFDSIRSVPPAISRSDDEKAPTPFRAFFIFK